MVSKPFSMGDRLIQLWPCCAFFIAVRSKGCLEFNGDEGGMGGGGGGCLFEADC